MNTRVYLVQSLCPQRHCVLANAIEAPFDMEQAEALLQEAQAVLLQALRTMIAENVLNPWCEMCHSREFHTEAGRTRWATLSEALPHLKQSEADQLATQQQMKAARN